MDRKFHELEVPQQTGLGWYVVSKHDHHYYLHHDGDMHAGTSGDSDNLAGYFPTEEKAHTEANCYYIQNGRKYPHSIESGENGSLPMTFA